MSFRKTDLSPQQKRQLLCERDRRDLETYLRLTPKQRRQRRWLPLTRQLENAPKVALVAALAGDPLPAELIRALGLASPPEVPAGPTGTPSGLFSDAPGLDQGNLPRARSKR